MVARPPEPNLPPHSMPWGRSVDERIAETELRLLAQASDDTSDAATTRAAADSISEQLGELVSVMGISRYDLPSFSISYPSIPIGGAGVLLTPPTWYLNVASGPEFISVILRLWLSDSAGASRGPKNGNMLFEAGGESALIQSSDNPEAQPMPRSAMLTVPMVHPMPISISLLWGGTTSGTLTGRGEATLVMYGR